MSLHQLSTRLIEWYDRSARQLPWRVAPRAGASGVRPDPYHVWLSEVMLQQTTVAAVKPYFARFVNRWPTVADLAAAGSDEVMAEWAGLGYYARARNLHACAKSVVADHGGRFPETEEALKRLPGIGDYTGAAIAAIAFGEPAAVVDGNVERVVTRLHAVETPLPAAKAAVRAHVAAVTPAGRPGDFAQAMMDLGATICTPTRPACVICPLSGDCLARQRGTMERYPVKAPKRAKPRRAGAAFVAWREADGALWLVRRPPSGMLGGTAGPPMSDWSIRADGATGAGAAPFPADWRPAGTVAHGFTHFELALEVWTARIAFEPPGEGWWSPGGTQGLTALPTLMKKAVRAALPFAPASAD